MTETYDVVIDALKTKHDALMAETTRNMNSEITGLGIIGLGIMDDIRLEQCGQLKEAMCVWEAHKRGDTI